MVLPKTIKKYRDYFEIFLINNDALEAYINNLDDTIGGFSEPIKYLEQAFILTDTPEGFSYWVDLCISWRQIVNMLDAHYDTKTIIRVEDIRKLTDTLSLIEAHRQYKAILPTKTMSCDTETLQNCLLSQIEANSDYVLKYKNGVAYNE